MQYRLTKDRHLCLLSINLCFKSPLHMKHLGFHYPCDSLVIITLWEIGRLGNSYCNSFLSSTERDIHNIEDIWLTENIAHKITNSPVHNRSSHNKAEIWHIDLLKWESFQCSLTFHKCCYSHNCYDRNSCLPISQDMPFSQLRQLICLPVLSLWVNFWQRKGASDNSNSPQQKRVNFLLCFALYLERRSGLSLLSPASCH